MIEKQKIKIFIQKNQKIIAFASAGFFVFIFSVLVSVIFNHNEASETQEVGAKSTCNDCVRRKIDGAYIREGEENFPVAVVIDNHTEARPSKNLSKANLVYEVEAEGSITRYLAFFEDYKNIEEIGSIRSARPYFIDWVKEFGAVFVHCGGSPEALVKIKKEDVNDMNEFYNGQYFWRDDSRVGSHDLTTSGQYLSDYITDKGFETENYLSWRFKDDTPLENASSSDIIIDYKEPYYVSKWIYDQENNDYLRYLAGDIHKDAEGNEIRAKNVVIQFAKTKVLDEELRLKIETIGENKAIICLDGECQAGTWEKKRIDSRTRFYYENNNEVEFNAGTTWVQVVRDGKKVKY